MIQLQQIHSMSHWITFEEWHWIVHYRYYVVYRLYEAYTLVANVKVCSLCSYGSELRHSVCCTHCHSGQYQTTTFTVENIKYSSSQTSQLNLFHSSPPPLPSSSLAIQDNHATVKDAEESWHLLSLWHSDLRSSLFIQLHRHQSSCTLLCDGAVYTLPKEVGTPEQERQKKRRERCKREEKREERRTGEREV